MAAIDPSFTTLGPDWQIGGVGGLGSGTAGTGAATQAGGFGSALASSLQSLQDSQEQAAQASRDLATGQADDATSVVMSVERAQLAMQLASTLRTKAVEAAQDIFHTQV
jgi:flagellar hook-basal body complex protein FliE